jgi:23S rRNA pseudouridine1911/1915/1917 synthase
METLRVSIDEETPDDCRVDRYITEHLDLFSRSQLKVRTTGVRINGRVGKLGRRVRHGDIVEIDYELPETTELEPEPMDLDVLYEDRDVIVVNKPQGLVVHPGSGHFRGTLVSGILHHCRSIAEEFEGEPVRPGIVHRLDKDTSGVIIVAKRAEIHEHLARQFRMRRTRKVYYAIVKGCPPTPSGIVDLPIGRHPRRRKEFCVDSRSGRSASTGFRRVRRFPHITLVRFAPKTGRTHQIRVHAVALGCPILGDPIYSRRDGRFPDATLMLHAYSLALSTAPGAAPRRFHAPLPDRFHGVLEGKIGSA